MPAHKIEQLLAVSDDLKALSAKTRCLLELQRVFFDFAPDSLAGASRVKNYRAGTLFLVAENAAIAAKLRQLAPRLLSNIRTRDLQVTKIQVSVQVTRPPNQSRVTSRKKTLGSECINEFKLLAQGLPDSPLKSAIRRFVRRHSRSE